MVIGIGTDILAIARIAGVITRNGNRFAQRILTPFELGRVDGLNGRAMAKVFAAKEAVVKALGTGFRLGISWQDITIDRDLLGKPTVELSGAAKIRFELLGGTQILLSISDERTHVVAFAVID